MSLPVLLTLIDELEREPVYFGNDFGLGLLPHHIHNHSTHGRRHFHNQDAIGSASLPLSLFARQLNRRGDAKDSGRVVSVGKDGFQVCMDVAQFKPTELNVKVVDNHIIVEGKHEEREDDHGYISRHFVRRYRLPDGYDAERIASTLSSDGVLTVSIPKPQLEDKSAERVIQIQQVGPAHLNVKQNSVENAKEANGAGDATKK